MTEHLESEIKRLLDETESPSQAGQPSSSVRARLAADISQALAAPQGQGTAPDDLAAKSAFLDGGLPASERDAFAAALAEDENLRADMESARALLDTVSDAPAPVPAHLLRQVLAEQVLAEAVSPPASVDRGSIWSWLRPAGSRPRLLWAAAAVAALLMIVPALLTADHLGLWPWSENEPLSADHPDIEPPKACPDAAAQSPLPTAQQQAEKEQRAREQAERQAARQTEPQPGEATPDAPCPPPSDAVDQPPKAPAPAAPANP